MDFLSWKYFAVPFPAVSLSSVSVSRSTVHIFTYQLVYQCQDQHHSRLPAPIWDLNNIYDERGYICIDRFHVASNGTITIPLHIRHSYSTIGCTSLITFKRGDTFYKRAQTCCTAKWCINGISDNPLLHFVTSMFFLYFNNSFWSLNWMCQRFPPASVWMDRLHINGITCYLYLWNLCTLEPNQYF